MHTTRAHSKGELHDGQPTICMMVRPSLLPPLVVVVTCPLILNRIVLPHHSTNRRIHHCKNPPLQRTWVLDGQQQTHQSTPVHVQQAPACSAGASIAVLWLLLTLPCASGLLHRHGWTSNADHASQHHPVQAAPNRRCCCCCCCCCSTGGCWCMDLLQISHCSPANDGSHTSGSSPHPWRAPPILGGTGQHEHM
jgi:hypothetical protein